MKLTATGTRAVPTDQWPHSLFLFLALPFSSSYIYSFSYYLHGDGPDQPSRCSLYSFSFSCLSCGCLCVLCDVFSCLCCVVFELFLFSASFVGFRCIRSSLSRGGDTRRLRFVLKVPSSRRVTAPFLTFLSLGYTSFEDPAVAWDALPCAVIHFVLFHLLCFRNG